VATDLEIIAKSGAWYSYKGERLGQGRENVKEFLRQHPEISNEIEQVIKSNITAVSHPVEDGDVPEDD